jgi:hypothetical protein
MRKLSKGYPHPVLGIDDDIVGEFKVRVEISYQEIEKALAISLSYELINSDLENLMIANKAELVATVYCPSTMTTWTTNTASIFVPKDALRDKFVLNAVIVANDRLVEYSSDTFADIFEGLSFTVEKGGILADGGQQSFFLDDLEENRSMNSLFHFVPLTNQDIVDYSFDSNRITIRTPVGLAGEKIHARIFNLCRWAGYFAFAQPALTAAFAYLKENPEVESEWKWAETLVRLCPHYENDEPHVSAQYVLGDTNPVENLFLELISIGNNHENE